MALYNTLKKLRTGDVVNVPFGLMRVQYLTVPFTAVVDQLNVLPDNLVSYLVSCSSMAVKGLSSYDP